MKIEYMLQRFSCISFLFKPPWSDSETWGNGDPGTRIEGWGPEKTNYNSRVGLFRSIFWVGFERFYFLIVLMLIDKFSLEREVYKIDIRNAIQ